MRKILIPLLLFILVLSGCEKEPNNDLTTYTVEFNTNGGSLIDTVNVEKDTMLITPENPTKYGYTFGGWYRDDENLLVEINPIIESDTILNAKWIEIEPYMHFYWGEYYLGTLIVSLQEEFQFPPFVLEGYIFDGWYTDEEFTDEFTSIDGLLDDISLYAKMELADIVVPAEGTIDLASLPYNEYLNDTNPVITITVKDVGVMTLQLFPDVAKNSVDNMIQYINDGDYTGSEFHRIIEDFMIQGGIVESANCAIEGEFSSNGIENDLSHYRGVLSMARTSVKDSGTSQFFIVHKDYASLNGEYAAFGGLISGFNVLDFLTIQATNPDDDSPFRTFEIESITIELNGYTPALAICAE